MIQLIFKKIYEVFGRFSLKFNEFGNNFINSAEVLSIKYNSASLQKIGFGILYSNIII